MRTFLISALGGVALAALTAAMPVAPGPIAGKILVLDNDQLIEGEISREGDRYSIRRGSGETIVPASRVIEVVGDRRQAFRVIRDRSNTRDWDERIRLIHWCMENQLRDEALIEANVLLKFRPQDAHLQALIQGLQSLPAQKPKPIAKALTPVKPVDDVLEIELPDYNRESFPLFVSKVQPILMNACAKCHTGDNGGHFVLVRANNGANRKATLFNLAATMKQLNRSHPSASPLLEKAVTAHGKAMHSAIRDQQSLAYQHLESWAISAVESDGSTPLPASVLKAPEEERAKPQPKTVEPAKPAPADGTFGESSSSQAKPEPQLEAKDQFDPAIFNGTIQPKK